MEATYEFYSRPGPITDLAAVAPELVARLPTDTVELGHVTSGLVIHEFLATAYGVNPTEDRSGELETRTVTDLIAAITAIDDRPLHEARPPELRLFGNCRQFCVLTCALLRSFGIPARCRAGFADYFEPGMWTDHWIIERWSVNESRWIQTDPQLDDVQRRILGIEFDPGDLPPSRFLTGDQAWRACRAGRHDPHQFGIEEMRGMWFIAGAAIRDLAALNKVETHTWDTWGVMNQMSDPLDDDHARLVDGVATAVGSGDLTQIRALYRREEFTMPGTVTSQRTQSTVSLPV